MQLLGMKYEGYTHCLPVSNKDNLINLISSPTVCVNISKDLRRAQGRGKGLARANIRIRVRPAPTHSRGLSRADFPSTYGIRCRRMKQTFFLGVIDFVGAGLDYTVNKLCINPVLYPLVYNNRRFFFLLSSRFTKGPCVASPIKLSFNLPIRWNQSEKDVVQSSWAEDADRLGALQTER